MSQARTDASRPRQRTSRSRANRSDDIREAALTLFADKGYDATTMDDIGMMVNLRGPSLYKHVSSKQDLLVAIMAKSVADVQRDQDAAVASSDDVVLQIRRAVEAHVRFHARHRREAFVGHRELRSLDKGNYERIVAQRRTYELGLRALIERGMQEGRLQARSAKLSTLAILDMGIGIAGWFREGQEFSVDELAWEYGDMVMRQFGLAAM